MKSNVRFQARFLHNLVMSGQTRPNVGNEMKDESPTDWIGTDDSAIRS